MTAERVAAFTWLNEEIERDLRKRYRSVRNRISEGEFYSAWHEQVKRDAMRLRNREHEQQEEEQGEQRERRQRNSARPATLWA